MNLQIEKRSELPSLLKQLGLKGKGVEIGVQTGRYSKKILSGSDLTLFSVDPWIRFPRQEYRDVSNVFQLQHSYRYLKTILRLLKFKTRSVCLRMLSEDAAQLFKPGALDFVYIDAVHTYEGCKKDIELWWPKVKKGGVFAGHDYVNGKFFFGNYGVKKAVNEFVKKHKLKLYVTKEKWPTWYVVKK